MNEDLFWAWVVQIIAVYVGYRWGQFVAARRMIERLISKPDDIMRDIEHLRRLRQDSQSQPETPTEELTVERHGDQLYVYTQDTREFLGQGSTLQEALDRIEQRFPGRNFRGRLTKDQADALGVSVK